MMRGPKTSFLGVRMTMARVADNSDIAQYRISDSSSACIVFGRDSDAADLRLRLGIVAGSKIEEATRAFGLSELQRQKLQLASKGDIKRLIDQHLDLEQEFRAKIVTADEDDIHKMAQDLSRKASPLRSRFSDPFDATSLYAKTLNHLLDAMPNSDSPE